MKFGSSFIRKRVSEGGIGGEKGMGGGMKGATLTGRGKRKGERGKKSERVYCNPIRYNEVREGGSEVKVSEGFIFSVRREEGKEAIGCLNQTPK